MMKMKKGLSAFKFLLLVMLVLSCSQIKTNSSKGKDYGVIEFTEGMDHLYGKEGKAANQELAFEYFQKSAAKGNPLAMDMIGGYYSVGMGGVTKSCKNAIEWFDKAAKLGYALSVNNLAYSLVSCEDESVRNPYRAKDYMNRLFQKETEVITYLDTMAAIYAELDKFEQAVQYQAVVVDLAKVMDLEEERTQILKESLELYKKKKKLPKGYQADTKTFKEKETTDGESNKD
jgi:hypothetical protein